MDSNEVNLIKNELSELPYSFIFNDISIGCLINDEDFPEVCKLVKDDPNFILIIDDENEGERFISKKCLYHWYINLNLKLAISKLSTLSEIQVLSQMNSLRLSGRWKKLPVDYIKYGQEFGLISCLKDQDRYNFPLSYAISLSGIEAAREFLLNESYDEYLTPHFEQLILERLKNTLHQLTNRQQYVIMRRQGILGFNKMTLEEIGQELKVTRERVRQLEGSCWIKRHKIFQLRFTSLLLIYILNKKGSLMISSSKIQQEMEFICECLNVPLWRFPYVNVMSIGYGNNNINLPENIWTDPINLKSNINKFLSNLPLQLIQEDVEVLTEMLAPIVFKHLSKTQKAYLTLKQIGKETHYSEVKDKYMDMFPGEYVTENGVHALLLQEKHGVVWTGSKGKFALEEWGYKRPTSSLMDTITGIVEEKYRSTGNCVPFIVIQAEIGKYRKSVNPNSVFIASYLNPKLKIVDDFCFLPQEVNKEEEEVDDDKLDELLKRFEEKNKNHER